MEDSENLCKWNVLCGFLEVVCGEGNWTLANTPESKSLLGGNSLELGPLALLL